VCGEREWDPNDPVSTRPCSVADTFHEAVAAPTVWRVRGHRDKCRGESRYVCDSAASEA